MPPPTRAAATRLLVAALALAPANPGPAEPQWWSSRGVLDIYAPVNDFGPANIGQLKHFASRARDEFEARLPGGAGAAIDALVDGWYDPNTGQPLTPNPPEANYAPINLGQLKAVAKPFYDRLIALDLLPAGAYPWTATTTDDANYAPGNIGQLKNVFNIDVLALVAAGPDSDGDGMPDAWEIANSLDPNDPNDANADPDGDGVSNLEEFRQGLNPNNGDSDGDGIPDYIEAAEANGGKAKPGAGDEDDPNDEPLPAFTPPHFVVLPLAGPLPFGGEPPLSREFVLAGTPEAFARAWITDQATVAAVKKVHTGEKHLVWKDGVTTRLWPRAPDEYPRSKLVDASRSGRFLLDVTYWDETEEIEKMEFRVVGEEAIAGMTNATGTRLSASMPEDEIKALPYYTARLAEFETEHTLAAELITQQVHSVFQISESGNVIGIIHVTVRLMPAPGGSGGGTTGYLGTTFNMLLPYYWKTGSGGGSTGSLHGYFVPDSQNRYWSESTLIPTITLATGPNFTYHYFGGLDTLEHTSQGGPRKIGVVWPGLDIPQYTLPTAYEPRDGSTWGSTVSATTTFRERSLSDNYDDSQLPTAPPPPPAPDGVGPAAGLTNTRWWNLANLNRPADPANNLPAINGPAFIVKAPNGTGSRAWQAWPMEELVAGMAGPAAQWSGLEQKHMANTGVIVAGIHDTENAEDELVLLLPVSIEAVSFWGETIHQLESDNRVTTYNAPHWWDKNGDGTSRTDPLTGERNYPVAFTRNTVPTVGAKFRISGLPAGREVRIRANSLQDLDIPQTSVLSDPGGIVSLQPTPSSIPLGDAIKLHDAEGTSAFRIDWEIRVAGGDWCSIGSTHHTVYVTWADPIKTADQVRFETLFNLGCRKAEGLGEGASEQSVVDAIYGEFTADREVRPVKPSRGTQEAESLKYWDPGDENFTTSKLLELRDGRCGAWARFFIDVLRAQGIDSNLRGLDPPTPPPAEIIAALEAANPGVEIEFTFVAKLYVKNWDTEVPFDPNPLPGMAAQGNEEPPSRFDDHSIVEYAGKFYDPSYGSGPYSLSEWEDHSIQAFGGFIMLTAPIQGTLEWIWKVDPKGTVETVPRSGLNY